MLDPALLTAASVSTGGTNHAAGTRNIGDPLKSFIFSLLSFCIFRNESGGKYYYNRKFGQVIEFLIFQEFQKQHHITTQL
jgi:hypothetical protein